MWEQILFYFQTGGWVMVAIAVISVAALAVFLERQWVLRQDQVIPEGLAVEVEDLLERGKVPEAITVCKKSETSLSKVLLAAVSQAGKSRELIKERIEEVGRRETSRLEKYLPFLGTLVTLAPLLGLLGTVIGMVELFSSIATQGEVENIGVIAGGVYKALYTTVFGLAVAIPSLLAHRLCTSRVERLVFEMEEIALRIMEKLK